MARLGFALGSQACMSNSPTASKHHKNSVKPKYIRCAENVATRISIAENKRSFLASRTQYCTIMLHLVKLILNLYSTTLQIHYYSNISWYHFASLLALCLTYWSVCLNYLPQTRPQGKLDNVQLCIYAQVKLLRIAQKEEAVW